MSLAADIVQTRKSLFEICKKECKNTYYIQTLVDLDLPFQSFSCVGITAGASTPNKIIEEVQKMSEMSFEQMLDESFKTIRNGEVVEGTVIDVKDDQIILNIGYKADGIPHQKRIFQRFFHRSSHCSCR